MVRHAYVYENKNRRLGWVCETYLNKLIKETNYSYTSTLAYMSRVVDIHLSGAKKTCFHRVVDSSETLPHMEDARRINEYRTTKQNRKKSILMRQTRYLLDTGAGKQSIYYLFGMGKGKELFDSIRCKPILLAQCGLFFLLRSFTGSGGTTKTRRWKWKWYLF